MNRLSTSLSASDLRSSLHRVSLAAVLLACSAFQGSAATGSWAGNAGGDWSTPANWTNGIVADGAGSVAFFTNNITASRTVTNGPARELSGLVFSDADPLTVAAWTLTGAGMITFAPGSTNSIDVTTTIALPLAGDNFAKTGPGTLVLSGSNAFGSGGTFTYGTGTDDSGAIRLASSFALGSNTAISLPTANTAVNTIELSGSRTFDYDLSTAGRALPTFLRNASGSNVWNGGIMIANSGGSYAVEVSNGTLVVAGGLSNAISAPRTFILTGAGTGIVSGVIQNKSGTVSVTKTATGPWLFATDNTYSGTTTLTNGSLTLVGSGDIGTGPCANFSALLINRTSNLILANVISGTGTVSLINSAQLTLSASNSYSGGTFTTGSDRRLSVDSDFALGTGPVTLGETPGSGQVWLHSAGNHTLANDFEIRAQRWIFDSNSINGNAPGSLTLNGDIFLNQSGARDLFCNQSATLNGTITSALGLTKQGGSSLTLNGVGSYTGVTTLTQGPLIINGRLTNSSALNAASGTTLGGTGVISCAVSITNGATLRPGLDGTGLLTVGKLTLATNATTFLTFTSPGAPGDGRLRVNGNLILRGEVNFASSAALAGSYTNITYTGTLLLTNTSLILPGGFLGRFNTNAPGAVSIDIFEGGVVGPLDSELLTFTNSLTLDWLALAGATGYRVYFGTNSSSVTSATTNSPLYLGQTLNDSRSVSNLIAGVTYYWRVDYTFTNGAVLPGTVWSFSLADETDFMADTWVGTDALNRELPGIALVGPPREERPIGMFYFLWHYPDGLGSDGPRDNTKEILRLGGYANKTNAWDGNPASTNLPTTPLWMTGSNGRSWYWGEPEFGYYAGSDPWVIRRHIAMLMAAGVDVLCFDTTNGHPDSHEPIYLAIANVIRQMRSEGMKVNLKFMHVTHGGTGGSTRSMNWLYDNFYRPSLYPDLWFRWQGKPMIIGYTNGLNVTDDAFSDSARAFFNVRRGWANGGGSTGTPGMTNEWQWIDTPTPQNWGYDTRTDIAEHTPVTCGGWANGNLGRSHYNRVQPGYDNFHMSTNRTEGLGRMYDEQMFYGLKLDPQFMFVTGWNEWWAGAWDAPVDNYTRLLTQGTPAGKRYFVDNYNAEYSRDIEPMKGGFYDNYFFQLVANNRQRKGVRPLPAATAPRTVDITGSFAEWTGIGPAYRDTPNDTLPRNFTSTFSNLPNYTNTTGRNDFRLLKVARDTNYLYFYAQTASNITSSAGTNWMLLFLDTDRSRATGWEGYDYVINAGGVSAGTTTLKQNPGTNWAPTLVQSDLAWKVTGNQLMIRVPRASLGLTNDTMSFDFHWADNVQALGDLSEFGVNGDSAPDRRFNYRYQTWTESVITLRDDDFENGAQSHWGETYTNGGKWTLNTTLPYSGTNCLRGTGAASGSSTLINRIPTTNLDSVRVSFRYKLSNVTDADNISVQFRTASNTWSTIRELGRDQYHASGQAWGYDERQNVWLYFSDARLNSDSNATFFSTNFAVQILISNLTSTSDIIALDDFLVTATRNTSLPGTPSNPSPAHLASNVVAAPSLTWTPAAQAETQFVYFALGTNPVLVATLPGSATNFVPGALLFTNTYTWRIDTTNAAGFSAGPVWTFTTTNAPNPNVPPTLAPIASQTLVAGQTLTVTPSATDTNLPAQTLTFSLPVAPSGAGIHATNGLITWRPTLAQSPGSNGFSVVVTDNGLPALSATQSFWVTVLSPPIPSSPTSGFTSNGLFQMSITGSNGPDYMIEASTNLIDWQPIWTTNPPVLPFLYTDTNSPAFPNRFYRIRLGP